MEFEWDPVKAQMNLEKHAISFVAAIAVFDDPFLLQLDSTKPQYGEVRGKAIGKVHDGRVITVVFTDRPGVRRIISARKARKNEKAIYDQGQASA